MVVVWYFWLLTIHYHERVSDERRSQGLVVTTVDEDSEGQYILVFLKYRVERLAGQREIENVTWMCKRNDYGLQFDWERHHGLARHLGGSVGSISLDCRCTVTLKMGKRIPDI